MNIDMIKTIYSHMTDEISSKIYIARLNASLTYDDNFINDLPDEYKTLTDEIISFKTQLLDTLNLRIVVFGAGFNGQHFVKQILKGDAFAFIDNYSNEKTDKLNGLPIYSLQDYINSFGSENTAFVISVSDRDASTQIFEQLRQYSIDVQRILIAPEDYRNNSAQYFDVFEPNDNETFVDCGAYDGSTAFRFASWCGKKNYDKIWCFEPDFLSFKTAVTNCLRLKNCSVYPYGISDSEKEVSFISDGSEAARIGSSPVSDEFDTIKTVQLDKFLRNEKVSFIKMDIEGEEYNALIGAKNIITEQRPRLAISVYHRNDDILKIPELLLELNPDYKFCMRHYSILTNETILYAY